MRKLAPGENPDYFDLITDLRETLGMFAGAMSKTPQAAWEEAIAEVLRLRRLANEVGVRIGA